MSGAAVVAPPAWQLDAACADTDPGLWFPGPSPERDEHPVVLEHLEAVRPICGRCPVASACLVWAVDTDQRHGLWAATTPSARRAMRRAVAADDLPRADKLDDEAIVFALAERPVLPRRDAVKAEFAIGSDRAARVLEAAVALGGGQ